MFQIRIIKSYRDIVALCDSELIGKKFEEGNLQLDIKEDFFKGEDFNEEQASLILKKMEKEDATFYIVGEKSINLCIKKDLIKKDFVKYIQGIPFCLILL
ncbi:DUF424 family protein [Candidatus Woesearchaeota archaeon]|nr:DUF424 family protein [Candidatus Woesearchaeota archaeon]